MTTANQPFAAAQSGPAPRRRPARRARAALAVTGIATIALALTGCGFGDDDDNGDGAARIVKVSGHGEVTGKPDTLTAEIAATASAPDVSAALAQANAAADKITTAATDAGLAAEKIATTNLSVNPDYAPGTGFGGTTEITGYTATQTITLTMGDTATASAILDAATKAGGNATRVNNVTFSIEDDETLLKAAREEAFTEAKTHAEQYAELAGLELKGVRIINEVPGSSVDSVGVGAPAADMAELRLSPGEQRVSFDITAEWEIG